MNKFIIGFILLFSVISYAGGGGGGGGGVRPGMQVFAAPTDLSREFVKTLDVQDDVLTLLYKPLGSSEKRVLELQADAINPDYADALLKSWTDGSWVEIQ